MNIFIKQDFLAKIKIINSDRIIPELEEINIELHELKGEMAEKLEIESDKLELISDIAEHFKIKQLFVGLFEKITEKLVFEGLKKCIEKQEEKDEINMKESETSEMRHVKDINWPERRAKLNCLMEKNKNDIDFCSFVSLLGKQIRC